MEKDLAIDSLRIWTSMKQAELARNKNVLLALPSLHWGKGKGGGNPLLKWTVLRSQAD